MGRILRQGLELGALGFSTDQVVGNPGPGGTALPGQVCGEDELLALAAVLGAGPGPGLFTMANAALLQGRAERVADLDWHQRLAQASGRPVVVGPIFGSHDDPGGAVAIMDLVLAGAATGRYRGAPDLHPSLRAVDPARQPGPARALPADVDAQQCGPTVRRASARWPPTRPAGTASARRGRSCRRRPSSLGVGSMWVCATPTSPMCRVETWPRCRASETWPPPTCCSTWPWPTIFDTQVATVMRNGDDDEVAELVAHPAAMIGASDAGAHILANTDSCYAVWTLQHWVRERKALTLERAVAKLTGDQARLLGLTDRGPVQPGLAADLVLFDPDRHWDHGSPVRRRPARGWTPSGDRRRRRRDERGQRGGGHAATVAPPGPVPVAG